MSSLPPPQRTHYFAYGSNIHVAQMAQRCPGSIFEGKATLNGYKWQINERGVANVRKAADGSSVEGLVYSITPKDRRALDRSEGVSRGFYQRRFLKVTLESKTQFENTSTPYLSTLLTEYDPSWQPDDLAYECKTVQVRIRALVYVSELYITDGPIREEYIGRIQKAMLDGRTLGISHYFIEDAVMPLLGSGNDSQIPQRRDELDAQSPSSFTYDTKNEPSEGSHDTRDSQIWSGEHYDEHERDLQTVSSVDQALRPKLGQSGAIYVSRSRVGIYE